MVKAVIADKTPLHICTDANRSIEHKFNINSSWSWPKTNIKVLFYSSIIVFAAIATQRESYSTGYEADTRPKT